MGNGLQRGRYEAFRGMRRADPWLHFILGIERLMDLGIERGFVNGFVIENGVSVSTLQFANDIWYWKHLQCFLEKFESLFKLED